MPLRGYRWRLLIDGWCIIAACIAAAVGAARRAARGVVSRILVVFDGTVIAGGDALDYVSVAVVAGDVDARVLELLHCETTYLSLRPCCFYNNSSGISVVFLHF